MALKADIAILHELSASLRELSDDARSIMQNYESGDGGGLKATEAAIDAAAKVRTSLVPSLAERLDEIGGLMATVASEFKETDEIAADKLSAIYTVSSGTWTERR